MKYVVILYLVVVNIVTFYIYGLDKKWAKQKKRRIPEKVLIEAAVIGGSIGALAGMKAFRHKIRKPKFSVGVPVIFLAHVVVAVAIYFIK